MLIRTYSELTEIESYLDRFEYLKLGGGVSDRTFGGDRWLNQRFYKSKEWKDLRHKIAVRDLAKDLAHEDYPIAGTVYIHHINPLTPEDLKVRNLRKLLDPENLVCVSLNTHNAIHYGDSSLLIKEPVVRTPGDTKLW